MEKQKHRRHRLTDAHPIAAQILSVIIAFILVAIIGGILEMIFVRVLGILPEKSGYTNAASAFIVLFIYRLWFKPEFEGSLKGGQLKPGLKLWTPILVSWLTVPFMFMLTDARFGWPTFMTVGSSLAAGCCEETIFRAYPLNTIMRKCRGGKMILTGAIISSVIFGVAHGLNGLSGADPGRTLFQIIDAGFIGLFLAALYLRCGNLWPPVIVHTLNDILAMTNVADIAESGMITGGVSWWTGVDAVSSIIVGLIGLWMIRPAKRPEILDIWNRKWNTAEEM